jgi:hypothetical protein
LPFAYPFYLAISQVAGLLPFLNNAILQTLACYKVFLIPEEFFLIRLAGKPTIQYNREQKNLN